jgi:hypothetical protein
MQVGIVYCDGNVWAVYDSGDFAADKAKALAKEHPQYTWTYTYNTVLITSHRQWQLDRSKVETKA